MILLIGAAISLLVFLMLLWVFSSSKRSLEQQKAVAIQVSTSRQKSFTISSKDIETIAGDDVLTTQLDLARAYIETGRKNLARNILNNVMQHGTSEQKLEARRLLESFH